jgi:hypothetical protein
VSRQISLDEKAIHQATAFLADVAAASCCSPRTPGPVFDDLPEVEYRLLTR